MTLLTNIQTLFNRLQLIQLNTDIVEPYTADPTEPFDIAVEHPDIVQSFTADPTEHFNIADTHPDIVQSFTAYPTEH